MAAAAALVAGGCGANDRSERRAQVATASVPAAEARPRPALLAGMPSYPSLTNIYAAAGPNLMSPAVRDALPRVYVPDTKTNMVYVIDPATYKVIDQYPGGAETQHVVPSYDLTTLYATSSQIPGGSILQIDAKTGKPVRHINVEDVYNLYFTPDGRYAIVVAEYYQRLDFYDAKTWVKAKSVVYDGCEGINHMDFSADGRTALVSCEFANQMIAIDVASGRRLRSFGLDRAPNGMPQDTRLVPDGSAFLVADMHAGGVYVFDGQAREQIGFIPTGRGAHGIYFSRDGRYAYISNRDEGTITLLDLATRRSAATWTIPGGSPDMGGVSADGSVLWLAGRYQGEVYAISTADGKLLARIPVGQGPHGLLVWPQPGRYSLGHTGNIR